MEDSGCLQVGSPCPAALREAHPRVSADTLQGVHHPKYTFMKASHACLCEHGHTSTYMIVCVIRNKKRDACLFMDKDAHRK